MRIMNPFILKLSEELKTKKFEIGIIKAFVLVIICVSYMITIASFFDIQQFIRRSGKTLFLSSFYELYTLFEMITESGFQKSDPFNHPSFHLFIIMLFFHKYQGFSVLLCICYFLFYLKRLSSLIILKIVPEVDSFSPELRSLMRTLSESSKIAEVIVWLDVLAIFELFIVSIISFLNAGVTLVFIIYFFFLSSYSYINSFQHRLVWIRIKDFIRNLLKENPNFVNIYESICNFLATLSETLYKQKTK